MTPRVAGPSHRGCPMGPHGRHIGIHGVEMKRKTAPEDAACGAHSTMEDAHWQEHTAQFKLHRNTRHKGRRAGIHITTVDATQHAEQAAQRRTQGKGTRCGRAGPLSPTRSAHRHGEEAERTPCTSDSEAIHKGRTKRVGLFIRVLFSPLLTDMVCCGAVRLRQNRNLPRRSYEGGRGLCGY